MSSQTITFTEDRRKRLVREDDFTDFLKQRREISRGVSARGNTLCWWCNDTDCTNNYGVYSAVIDGVEYFYSDCDDEKFVGTVEIKHKQCSCCGADCVRHLGNQPHYVNPAGNVVSKYYNARGYTYFCEDCDHKLMQVHLKQRVNINDPIYVTQAAKDWIPTNDIKDATEIYDLAESFKTELARLLRNKRARELRQERKRLM